MRMVKNNYINKNMKVVKCYKAMQFKTSRVLGNGNLWGRELGIFWTPGGRELGIFRAFRDRESRGAAVGKIPGCRRSGVSGSGSWEFFRLLPRAAN